MINTQDQIKLEVEMVNAGINRFQHTLRKMKEKGLESATKHGRALMAKHIDPIAEGIIELQNRQSNNRDIASKKLKPIDAHVAAYISLIQLIDNLTQKCTLLKIALDIGKRLEDQIKLQYWIEEEGQIARNTIRKANEKTKSGRVQKRKGLTHKMNKDGFKFNDWSNNEHTNIGIAILNIILQSTPIIQKKKFRSPNGKTQYFILPNEGTLEWIQKFNEVAERARPRYSPMIVPPKDWNSVWGGGYYVTIINDLPLIRVH